MTAGRMAIIAVRVCGGAPDTCCGCLGAVKVSNSSEELPVAMLICV